MDNEKKLTPEEYHKQQKYIYRTIPLPPQRSYFKTVVRGGEVCVVRVDEEGNEIRDN